ncbi:MAG: lyase family protein, partial [Weissella confusa]
MRHESDSLGTVSVPATAYYGVHTQRAVENFPITGELVNPELIRGLIEIKEAAALVNAAAGDLPIETADAIVAATKQLLQQPIDYTMFPLDPIQGGAGTSMNMNVNEVVANLALELLGDEKGNYARINPNDHVNRGQSTNDVYPSAGK